MPQLPVSPTSAPRVAVVTGAGTGIGRAITLQLVSEGLTVVGVGRREGKLREVAEAAATLEGPATGLAGAVVAFPGDVTDRTLPERLAAFVDERFGRLDALVHNAGIFRPDSLATQTDASWDTQLDTNLAAPLRLTRALLPLLQKGRDASVVMVSSNLGLRPIPNALSYSISKAALNFAVTCLAPELGPLGVRVNTVCPGVIDTPIHDRFGSAPERTEYFSRLASATPVPRTGEPADVAHVVCFLASAAASYITGATLVVDGGLGLV